MRLSIVLNDSDDLFSLFFTSLAGTSMSLLLQINHVYRTMPKYSRY